VGLFGRLLFGLPQFVFIVHLTISSAGYFVSGSCQGNILSPTFVSLHLLLCMYPGTKVMDILCTCF
jgi:hypothetical protein